jgi:hypothetical protein
MTRRDIILVILIVVVVILTALFLVLFALVAVSPKSITARLWSVADSPISIAVVSMFIAAFAGTWGAQVLAEKTARRKEQLAEIRGTNAAIGLAFNIANTYITTKKQLVRDLVAEYERQSAEWQGHCSGVAAGTIPPGMPFKYQIELRTTFMPFSPVEELRQILRDRISPDGKAMILPTPLIQSIRGFADTVAQRNTWIEQYKRVPDETRGAHLYFGTSYAAGRADDRYPNFIKAIERQTDDCIAFSIMITESLKRYGDRLAGQYGPGAPTISAPDFGRAGDLLPDMRHYSEWVQT